MHLGNTYKRQIEGGYGPNVSIRRINKRVGYGVFAEEPLEADRYIGEYTGIVRENVRTYFAPLNNYCYAYPVPDRTGKNFVIDATQGSFTRFINHSYKPNLQPFYAFIDGFYHLIFISCADIPKGRQLTFDYGSSYWSIRRAPQKL